MNRRQFLKLALGAAVTIAAGVDLLKAPTPKFEFVVLPHWTDSDDWFLANGVNNMHTVGVSRETLDSARELLRGALV